MLKSCSDKLVSTESLLTRGIIFYIEKLYIYVNYILSLFSTPPSHRNYLCFLDAAQIETLAKSKNCS